MCFKLASHVFLVDIFLKYQQRFFFHYNNSLLLSNFLALFLNFTYDIQDLFGHFSDNSTLLVQEGVKSCLEYSQPPYHPRRHITPVILKWTISYYCKESLKIIFINLRLSLTIFIVEPLLYHQVPKGMGSGTSLSSRTTIFSWNSTEIEYWGFPGW